MTPEEASAAVIEHGGIRPAARALGIAESTLRCRMKKWGGPTPAPLPEHAFVPDASTFPSHIGEKGVETVDCWADQEVHRPGVRRYILTSAQNNAEVHEPFLRNLEALASKLGAQILVGFTVYDRAGYRGVVRKGEAAPREGIWWDKRVEEYAANVRYRLHKRLAFCGELDVLATTPNPLGGLDSYCGRSSVIVPHNRFAFRCVESRKQHMPKELYTTGSVTKPRFVQRKAGQVAHFHHVLGALLVEVTDEGYFYVHHLNAEDDGSFYWLDRRVESGRVRKADAIEAVVLGDIHVEKMDGDQAGVAMRLLNWADPRHVLLHDLIDFTSRNHHTRGDPLFRIRVGQTRVQDEIDRATVFLHEVLAAAPGATVAVVQSNHDAALGKWIKEADWKTDPVNARFYLSLALAMVEAVERGEPINPLAWAVRHFGSPICDVDDYMDLGRLRFLALDESYEVCGIECGMHGHVGPSGAPGSPKGFSRLGFKSFTAHTHSPSIVDGCYTVGVTGRLNMGYNVGPNKWTHTHGLIYANGKRALLTVKNGKWRA